MEIGPKKAQVVRSFIGHKERAFDVRYSSANSQVISACEDGFCRVWNSGTGKCTHTILHNKKAEVLRSAFLQFEDGRGLCTCGSDGNAIIWKESQVDAKMNKLHVLKHGDEAQIYVCESVPERSDLVIAAENMLILWDLVALDRPSRTYHFNTIHANEVSFGGHRNPENNVFVFDAKVNPVSDSIIGAALSDATIRLLDTRSPQDGAFFCTSLAERIGFSTDRIGHATGVSAYYFSANW